MSRFLTKDDFVNHVGASVAPKGQHRVLTLVEVESHDFPGWQSLPRQPFSLILRGPPGDVLPEGEYDVVIGAGQEFTLYISPVHTPARDRQDYQVGFN